MSSWLSSRTWFSSQTRFSFKALLLSKTLPLALLFTTLLAATATGETKQVERVSAEAFVSLLFTEPEARRATEEKIAATWQPGYAPMALEALRFAREPALIRFLTRELERGTDKRFGTDSRRWNRWLWSETYEPHPEYARFKSLLYRHVDPKFAGYFNDVRPATIRLDEVQWGGVVQDGIPPLRQPAMLTAPEAGYLDDGDVVFGLQVGSDARAYPKRILAWHEMFTDEIGGLPVAGVYCTLCGTVILYETEHEGVRHEIGTSGFLYRSNKLMYDRTTQSLWSTLEGRPVIGPLVGKGIELRHRGVVTTTWGEWRRRHPETQVLSLETGHRRDYAEGAAYRDYFATDELMFEVPERDKRLKNKAEVLTLRLAEHPDLPLALSARFLRKNPLHRERLGDVDLVVLTDRSGANRVYRTDGRRFLEWDQDQRAVDAGGRVFTLTEDALTSPDGQRLDRLPAQRAFWFGWYAAFPHTRLVK